MGNTKRVMIFIDGCNLKCVLEEKYGTSNINLQKTVKKIVEKAEPEAGSPLEIIRTYYYTGLLDKAKDNKQRFEEQRAFLNNLKTKDYIEVKLGKVVGEPGNRKEKGVDVLLAIDMVSMGLRDIYDIAILISGDSDFKDAIQVVKNEGKHVWVVYPKSRALSRELREVCDHYMELQKDRHIAFIGRLPKKGSRPKAGDRKNGVART